MRFVHASLHHAPILVCLITPLPFVLYLTHTPGIICTSSACQYQGALSVILQMAASNEYSEAYLQQNKQSEVVGVVIFYIVLEVITLFFR